MKSFDLSDPPMTYISKATPFKVFFVPELHNVSTSFGNFCIRFLKGGWMWTLKKNAFIPRFYLFGPLHVGRVFGSNKIYLTTKATSVQLVV